MRQGYDLSGRVAVVTGRANGIGEGSATSPARWGADIVTRSIDGADAARVVAAIVALGRRAAFIRADTLDPGQTGDHVDKAVTDSARSVTGQVLRVDGSLIRRVH